MSALLHPVGEVWIVKNLAYEIVDYSTHGNSVRDWVTLGTFAFEDEPAADLFIESETKLPHYQEKFVKERHVVMGINYNG